MSRWIVGLISLTLIGTTGCAITLSKRSPWDVQRLEALSEELEQFKTLAKLEQGEADQLRRAKDQLQEQVGSSRVHVGYDERGLVTRFVDRVLFDSGKAQLRVSAFQALDQVGKVLQEVADQPVGIEGHTDNEPIKYSPWTDNAELSVARANAVAEYLTSRHQIDRGRLTVIGYGEDRPIADNGTPEGRQKNRRVEIVILPRSLQGSLAVEAERVAEGQAPFSK